MQRFSAAGATFVGPCAQRADTAAGCSGLEPASPAFASQRSARECSGQFRVLGVSGMACKNIALTSRSSAIVISLSRLSSPRATRSTFRW